MGRTARHARPSAPRVLRVSVAAVVLAAGAASAQPRQVAIGRPEPAVDGTPAARERVRTLVESLDSSDYQTRAKASAALVEDEAITLSLIEEAFASGTTSLEGRARLHEAARQKFYASPRGAMGIQFGANLRDRVVVGKLFDKFPSSKLLEEGDMIVAVDGTRLEGRAGQEFLRALIVARDPGETLDITLRRGAEKLKMKVPLGRFDDLEGNFIGDARFTQAWQMRSQAYPKVSGEPIVVPVAASAWTEDKVAEKQSRHAMARIKLGEESPVAVVGGGMPRGAVMANEDPRLQTAMLIQARRGNARVFQQAWALNDQLPPMKPREELDELGRAANKMQLEMAQNAENPDVNAEERALRAMRRVEIERSLRLIEKQRLAVEAELREAGEQVPAPDAAATVLPTP